MKTVQDAGVDFITIHGRTRSTASSIPVNLEAIKLVREHCHVPSLANGDVFSLADAYEITEKTGVDGVMSARGLLENPGLFKPPTPGHVVCEWEVVERFMRYVAKAPLPFKLVVHHLTEMVGSDYTQAGSTLFTKEERMKLLEWCVYISTSDSAKQES